MRIPNIYIPVYLIITVLLVSCSVSKHHSTNDNDQNKGLELSSQVVTPSDKLTLRFPVKHPSKLAIQTPDNVWFIIHEPGITTRLMTDAEFRRSTSLAFQVGKLTGVTWIDGKQVRQKVFVKPGKYTIYMADNLETEPDNTFSFSQTLLYTPSP